ncbi:MAG: hypothetical protein HPAVJP_0870 [Candidatus Hepatoplasma vulgare]|nr:MAG: hypothetical protein HPAVJP_0870 [Candidatus Hepatoplasma sp.]
MKSSVVIQEFSQNEITLKKFILIPKDTEVVTFSLKDKSDNSNIIKFAKIDFKKNFNKDIKIKLNEDEFQVNALHKAITKLNGDSEFIVQCFKSENAEKNNGHVEYPLKNISCGKTTSGSNICKWVQINGDIDQYPFIFVKWYLSNSQFQTTKINTAKFVENENFLLYSWNGVYLRITRDQKNFIKQEFKILDTNNNRYDIGISEIYQSNTDIEV